MAYETPVVGYPWSIPFEFPLYQALVALLSCSFGWNLERVGRLMSYTFELACLFPVACIFRSLFPHGWTTRFLLFTPLFLLSPLYLFWSRTFMIETTALFFTLCFVAASLPFLLSNQKPGWQNTGWTGLFLALAILQKSTTALPVWLIVVVLVVLASGKSWDTRARRLFDPKVLVALVIPLLIGIAWTRYTDVVKAQSLAGHHLTSAGLAIWNFGHFLSRFSPRLWLHAVWNRLVIQNAGGILGAGLIALALWLSPGGDNRKLILANLAAFFLPFLIFTNLHSVHVYYQSANLVFLLLALALSISALWDRYPRRSGYFQTVFSFILVSDVLMFQFGGYAAAERTSLTGEGRRIVNVAAPIRENTPADKPIVIFGLDWSSELPFYSQRRAMAVPDWFNSEQRDDVVAHPAKYLAGEPSAFVFCGPKQERWKHLTGQYFQLARTAKIQDCEVQFLQ